MKSRYVAAALFALSACTVVLFAQNQSIKRPTKVESANLPNAFRLTEKVLSGGQPLGEPAFKELKEMGVRTVISVDGAKPNVELAKKYGLRYVHLPHGYDGIPDERLLELTKAIHELPGPIYIHCHHGKHRSPAAAAAACISDGLLSNDDGLAVLAAAGTSAGYRGLFQAVREAKPIDAKTLAAATIEFRETVDVPPLADAMTTIEHTHDNLKVIAGEGWKATEKHADIDPPHEALLLREHFAELLRTEDTAKQSAEFRQFLVQSEAHAQQLEDALRSGKAESQQLTGVFDRITADCTACHQKFRDIPLQEKQAGKK